MTKPSWVLMVNVCKPFLKHIWYGVDFNSNHEYERFVKVDFINFQNFQLLHLFKYRIPIFWDTLFSILFRCSFQLRFSSNITPRNFTEVTLFISFFFTKVRISEVYHPYFYVYEKIYTLPFLHLVRVCWQ